MNEHKSFSGTLERSLVLQYGNLDTIGQTYLQPLPMLQDVMRHFGSSQANLFASMLEVCGGAAMVAEGLVACHTGRQECRQSPRCDSRGVPGAYT